MRTSLGLDTSEVSRTDPPEPVEEQRRKVDNVTLMSVLRTATEPVQIYAVAHIAPPPLPEEQLMNDEYAIETPHPAAFITLPYPLVLRF